jgi:tubulin polyglutamylase TTLL7
MHLTNYSINKHSETFDKNEKFDKGSKRSLQYFNSWLLKNSYNIIELWAKIHDLVVKTLIVAQPHIQHSYQACRPGHMQLQDKCQCFEVLGFDVLIDENLRPWILEVNRSPSFGIETQLDVHIKTGVISDALKLLDIKPSDRVRKVNMQREASRRRLLQISNQSPRKQTLDIAGVSIDEMYYVNVGC